MAVGGDEAPESAGDGTLGLRLGATGQDTGPTRSARPDRSAGERPVAQVLVDTPLAHLDRPFEYLVPAELSETAVPGARVRVRFSGRDRDGFVLARTDSAAHAGRLQALRRVVSPEPVLTPELAHVCRAVADHYGGSMADVVRLAVPPRHAAAETQVPAGQGSVPSLAAPAPGPWAAYPAGPALLRHLAEGGAPRAVWSALPDAGAGDGWPAALAAAVAATAASGRRSLLVLPDSRDVDRAVEALERALGPEAVARLTADQGPRERYRQWLRALRGHAVVAVGNRAAAFAPLPDLGLVAWWDDGDDLHREPRSPYPHVREVLRLRALREGCGLLAGGMSRTAELQQWVERDRVPSVEPTSSALRRAAPRVLVAGEGHAAAQDVAAATARIPTLAWRTASQALARGPVLVQVPRRGYLMALSCQDCRTPVRCAACTGPVVVPGPGRPPVCAWCGATPPPAPCRSCDGVRLRAAVTGERRTAEELGRAFPGVPVRSSAAGEVLASVGPEPALVVATPGAEPVAEGGYAAALLLDGWALLDRAGLDSALEAHRRWSAAAALTRGAPDGGAVVLCGVPPHATLRPVEALVRWAGPWLAAAELADRRELRLPPVARFARVRGESRAVEEALAELKAAGAQLVAHTGDPDRGGEAVLREGPDGPDGLARSVATLRHRRSIRKDAGELQVVLDPPDDGGHVSTR